MNRRHLGKVAASVAFAALTLSFVGCSGSDDKSAEGDGVASVDEVEGATAAPTTAEAVEGASGEELSGGDGDPLSDPELEEQFAEFDKCMADQGIEMPEINEPSGNDVDAEVPDEAEAIPTDFDFEAFEAAAEECDDLLPQEGLNPLDDMTPEQRAAFDDFSLEMEKCMGDKGHDIPYTKMFDEESQDVFFEVYANLSDEELEELNEGEDACVESIGAPSVLEDFFDEDEVEG